MLLDRYLRSLEMSSFSSVAVRSGSTSGRSARAQSPTTAPTEAVTGMTGGDGCSYMLTRADDGGGLGWRLTFTAIDGPSWSMALTARGAGPEAPVRVAQAVAVRVLTGFGVDVQSWRPDHPTTPDPTAEGAPIRYCAVLASVAAKHASVADMAPVDAPSQQALLS